MDSSNFEDFGALYDWCGELQGALEKARTELSDAQWAEIEDSPFYEVLCAAMDVENAWLKCEGS
jgi:hypothetical protein